MSMELKRFVFNSFQVNAYIVSKNGKSILFDAPNSNEAELLAIKGYLESINSELIAVVLTHGHVDHIVGCSELQNLFNIPVYMHKDDLFLVENGKQMAMMFGFPWNEKPNISNLLESEGELDIEGIAFQSMHIPGHSPGSLVYYFTDDNAIITGDVIFHGSIGRSDLPGGDHNALITGIKSKIMTLSDDIKLYPGHGELTTVEFEKKNNPFL